MSETCGSVTGELECVEGTMEFTSSNSSETSAADIILNLNDGDQLFDPSGNLLYTADGGVKKAKIRKPKKAQVGSFGRNAVKGITESCF